MHGAHTPGPADPGETELASLRKLIWSGPILFFCWRPQPPDWPIMFVSANVEAVLGYSSEDFLSGAVTWPGITHPEDVQRVEQEVLAHLANGHAAWSQEYRVRTRAGAIRWFRDWNQAAYDAQGQPLRLQSLVLDLTDRKDAEDRLTQSERRYRLLYESLHDAFARVDKQGFIVEFNHTFRELLGYSAEQLVTLTYRDVTPAAWHGLEETIVRDQVLTRGFSDVYEKEYRRQDGTVFPVELRTYLLRDEAGQPTGMWAIVRDISDRKAAEAALAASERKYRLIVETAQEGIWIIDAESRTTFANTRMADLLGYTVDEMRGRSLFDFTDREGRQLAERNVQRRREGIGEQHEFRFIHRSGRPVWTLIETNPLRDEQGRYAGALAMVMDITARRLAEEERRNLQAGLLRLQKAESLGLMAGGIAHDFNNILTAITGNLDLARGQLTETHPAAACLRAAQQASDRAAELCRHMLTYSGGGHLDTARHDLADLLRAWQPALARELPAAQRLELALPERPLPVEVDPAQVRQALLHVLRNAVEAAGQDPGVITLAAQLRPCTADDLQTPWMPDQRPAGDYVEVSVTDRGGGMSTDTLQRIFDPFFSTKFTGRGLGLPATLGIVRMHHGVVKVESRLGEGTTVRLLLPLARGPAQPARATRSDAPAQRRTILVADDEPAIRSLCTQMLEHYGFSVLVAADGTEAVEVFQRQGDAVHCLLLDVTMPRMGGAEALQAIRRLSPHVPAIITSGYSEQDVAARFAHTPFDTFLQKPFNSHALRQAVQQALGRSATV